MNFSQKLTEFRLENIKTGLTLFGRINNNGFMDTNVPFLDKIVPLIVSLVSPDQIVLFGSYARGDNTEKSDIDLLIIKKNLNNAKIITDNLYMSFFDNKIKIPVDLIVVDYDKYNYLKNEIGYIYKTINEEGKLIYGTV